MQIEQQNIFYKFSLILLFAVFAFHLGRHVNDFYVPESDFFDFRDKAVTLRNLQWPDNFKRPPLYAASIALVSTVIPGHNRELYAAEAIGVAAVLLSLLLFYKIAFHFFGRNAVLLAWLWALHPSTLRMAVKPKSEILVTFFILWAFYLFVKEKKWAYAVAFLASCVRYEGALAIAAVGAADFFTRKEKLKTVLYSLIAGAFILLWTVLQSGGGDGQSYFSYFNDYKPNVAFLKSYWEALIGFLPDALHRYNVMLLAALLLLGLIYGIQKHRRFVFGLGVFFIGFLAMHIAWPMPNFDYEILIVWNSLLLFGFGVAWLADRRMIQTVVSKLLHSRAAVAVSGVLLIAALLLLFRLPAPFPQYRVPVVQWLLLMLPALLAVAAMFSGGGKSRSAPGLLTLALLAPLLYFMLSDTNALLYSIRYSKAEFRLTGEWFAANGGDQSKLAIEQPTVAAYYADMNMDRFVRLVDLPKAAPDSLFRWCRNNSVTHIAWLSANQIFKTDNAWYQWKMDNRGWQSIAFLKDGKSSHGFNLIKDITIGPRRAFIYKIE